LNRSLPKQIYRTAHRNVAKDIQKHPQRPMPRVSTDAPSPQPPAATCPELQRKGRCTQAACKHSHGDPPRGLTPSGSLVWLILIYQAPPGTLVYIDIPIDGLVLFAHWFTSYCYHCICLFVDQLYINNSTYNYARNRLLFKVGAPPGGGGAKARDTTFLVDIGCSPNFCQPSSILRATFIGADVRENS